jgi:hypothetical protein
MGHGRFTARREKGSKKTEEQENVISSWCVTAACNQS